MTTERLEKASELLRRIQNIDNILEFCREISEKPTDKICAHMYAEERDAKCECIFLDQLEVGVIRLAFENERARLKQQFDKL